MHLGVAALILFSSSADRIAACRPEEAQEDNRQKLMGFGLVVLLLFVRDYL
jgi:hypothetical protein